MDGPMERPHMSLINMRCALTVGGVTGVSITTNLGWNGDAIVSPHGLPRPTPMLGSVYDI